jgi:hypothetical protein
MSDKRAHTPRKPATKLPHLRKKLTKAKVDRLRSGDGGRKK